MSIFHKKGQVGKLEYGVYLPPGHKATGEPAPILCFLHGIRECWRSSDKPEGKEGLMIEHGPLKGGKPQGGANSFIVVVPQVPCAQDEDERSFKGWVKYAETVKEIVQMVRKEYNGNSQQIYLTGFSLGANGVLDIGHRQRDFWAALWPVDPGKLPEDSTDLPIWVSAGPHFRAAVERQNRVPKAQPNRVYEDAGLDHVRTATNAYSRPAIYKWLCPASDA